MDPKKFPVSWEEIHKNSKALAWRLVEQGPFEGVIGITRGGLVPACIIARELDIRRVDTLCIASYDHTTQGEAKIIKIPEEAGDGKGWLVIDDLVDTGNTFKLARTLLPNAKYAAIYAKPQGVLQTDAFIMEVSQDTWIDFPWDLEAQYSTPIADIKKQK